MSRHPALGLIVTNAQLLFTDIKPAQIIKSLYILASEAQCAGKQFIMASDDGLFSIRETIWDMKVKTNYDRGWLANRLRLISSDSVTYYREHPLLADRLF